jgi:hypothetical protein
MESVMLLQQRCLFPGWPLREKAAKFKSEFPLKFRSPNSSQKEATTAQYCSTSPPVWRRIKSIRSSKVTLCSVADTEHNDPRPLPLQLNPSFLSRMNRKLTQTWTSSKKYLLVPTTVTLVGYCCSWEMSDSDDQDLETLRQAALSSLIKKKNTTHQNQTNAVMTFTYLLILE